MALPSGCPGPGTPAAHSACAGAAVGKGTSFITSRAPGLRGQGAAVSRRSEG